MPIIVQHTPAGLVKPLAQQAGRGVARMREHDMAMDQSRLNLAQQGQQFSQQFAVDQASQQNAMRQAQLQQQQQSDQMRQQLAQQEQARRDQEFNQGLVMQYQKMQQDEKQTKERLELARQQMQQQAEQFEKSKAHASQEKALDRNAAANMQKQREQQAMQEFALKQQQTQYEEMEEQYKSLQSQKSKVELFGQYQKMLDPQMQQAMWSYAQSPDVTLENLHRTLQQAAEQFKEAQAPPEIKPNTQLIKATETLRPESVKLLTGNAENFQPVLRNYPQVTRQIMAMVDMMHPNNTPEQRANIAMQIAQAHGWITE